MRTPPTNWTTLMAQPHQTETRVDINNASYYGYDGAIGIWSLATRNALFESCSVGNCHAGQIDIVLVNPETIPTMAQMDVYVRLTNGTLTTDWVRAGIYYVDTREWDAQHEFLTITGYDAMLKTEQEYFSPPATITGWPKTDTAVVAEICARIGVQLDTRTAMSKGYSVPVPAVSRDGSDSYTLREVLGWVGAMYGGNWIITDEGKLRLVPLNSGAAPISLGTAGIDLRTFPAYDALGIVRVVVSEETEYTAGTTGREIEISCPWGTQTMANNLLAALRGYAYQPLAIATEYAADPLWELGDNITFNGYTSVIADTVRNYSLAYTADISAQDSAELEHEYKYVSKAERQIARTVQLGKPYYGTTIDRTRGLVVEKADGETVQATATFNADAIEFTDENGKKRLYYDADKGTFVFDGSLGAESVYTDSLYAEQGDVADITVRRLDTGDFISRYLTRDISDLNHTQITADDDGLPHIYLVSSVVQRAYASGTGYERLTDDNGNALYWTDELMTDATTAETDYPAYIKVRKLTNPYGESVYWAKDISDAEIIGGYPYVDGERVYTVTENTGFPVTVWDYINYNKTDYAFVFNPDSGYYEPKFTFGVGDQSGSSKGYIYKSGNGFRISYDRSARAGEIAIEMNNSGNLQKTVTNGGSSLVGDVYATLVFENVAVTGGNWTQESSPTFESYPYAAALTCTGATAAMGGEVIFSPDDIESGKLAAAAQTGTDTVTIYAKQPVTLTIPRIELRF